MPSQGFRSAATVTTGTPSGGTLDWTNPNNAKTNNGAYAVAASIAPQTTLVLRAKSYGFSIPSDARIDGIEVSYDRYRGGIKNVIAEVLRLINESSTFEGDNKGTAVPTSPGSPITFGGPSDLWGGSWAPGDINHSNFGVGVQHTVQGAFSTASSINVDYIAVKVHYTNPLTDPSNVIATVDSATQITLTWNDNSTGETGFRVQRRDNDGAWSTLVTAGPGDTSHVDTTVTEGNKYEYRVRANGDVNSSNVESNIAYTPPLIPTSCAIDSITPTQASISWVDNSSAEINYETQRDVNGAGFVLLTTKAAGSTSHVDATVTEGNSYTYRVRALGSNANSGFSTSSAGVAPAKTPTSLIVSAFTPISVTLGWNDLSGVETNYEIQRKTGAGAFATIDTIVANSTAYVDTSVAASTNYTYRVRAKASVDSAWSNEVSVTTPAGKAGGKFIYILGG